MSDLEGKIQYFGKDFFTYRRRLFHINNDYMRNLIKEKGVDYCVDNVGVDEVFGGVSDWSGDPCEEPSYHAELCENLFTKFLTTIEALEPQPKDK